MIGFVSGMGFIVVLSVAALIIYAGRDHEIINNFEDLKPELAELHRQKEAERVQRAERLRQLEAERAELAGEVAFDQAC